MKGGMNPLKPYQAARRFMFIGITASVVGVMIVAASVLLPIGDAEGITHVGGRERVPQLTPPDPALRTVFVKVAGSRLIRPGQIQAAVKDTGAAQRLLARLKLQSVVQLGGESVAYVQVADGGVTKVRRGEHLLDFVVEEIAPGNIRLLLDGVEVNLTY